ncbi:hypothetical protein PUN28_004763 [Cardiocondyla obscurior]|uniref:Uncharacterized protein n=1 Tax=Cardiocondyla obscurior TaxID=286306 RepID=A0AAW2GEC1_9HYME
MAGDKGSRARLLSRIQKALSPRRPHSTRENTLSPFSVDCRCLPLSPLLTEPAPSPRDCGGCRYLLGPHLSHTQRAAHPCLSSRTHAIPTTDWDSLFLLFLSSRFLHLATLHGTPAAIPVGRHR